MSTSPIKSFVSSGDYAGGQLAFSNLEHPSAEDLNWAGLCLAHLGRNVEALELLSQARALGFEAAGTILATVYRLLGEHVRGEDILKTIQTPQLDAIGWCLLERERGAVHYGKGEYRRGVLALERALEHAGQQDAQFLKAGVTSLLGYVLAHAGQDARAIDHLNLSLERATPSRRCELLTQRAICQMNLGNLNAAQADLTEARVGPCEKSFEGHLRYSEGQLLLFRGLFEEAMGAFLECAALARENREPEAEFYAELYAAHVATSTQALAVARAHLSRAKGIVNRDSAIDLAHLDWDYGALLARADNPDALRLFERAAATFERLGLERELGLVWLHLAELHFRLEERPAANAALRCATDARHSCGTGGVFALEVRDLPFVFENLTVLPGDAYPRILLKDWRALESQAPRTLQVTTLGRVGLALDGERVHITSGEARTVELIAFMLVNKHVQLEDLQNNVFGDKNPHQARRHVHVIRDFIRQHLTGLAIPFNPTSRSYQLEHPGLRVVWDANEVKRCLSLKSHNSLQRALALYTGTFLKDSESEWVIGFRGELEWALSNAGLTVVEDLYARGSFEACVNLSRALLEVNPVDASLALMLLKAVFALQGSSHASQELERLRSRFRLEIGEVPEEFEIPARKFVQLN